MKLVNLTPHIVRVYLGTLESPELDDTGSDWLVLPVTGNVAHIEQARDERHSLHGVPLLRWVYGTVTGVPAPQHGVVYVVSSLIGRHLCRPDCVSPDTKYRPITDSGNNLYAVRRLQQHIKHEQ